MYIEWHTSKIIRPVQFIFLGRNILFSEIDVNIWIDKAWTAIDRLMIMWKSDLSDKIKC